MRLRFPDGELGRWASLGAVSERSVRVWLRDPSGEPQQAIVEIDGVERGAVTLTPSSEHDWTAAGDLHLDRPRPNARFTVRVAGFKREGRFAPLPDTPAEFTFAFGSCHQPFGPPRDGTLTLDDGAGIYRPMDATLTSHEARFLALTGDQIYSDGVEPIERPLRRGIAEGVRGVRMGLEKESVGSRRRGRRHEGGNVLALAT